MPTRWTWTLAIAWIVVAHASCKRDPASDSPLGPASAAQPPAAGRGVEPGPAATANAGASGGPGPEAPAQGSGVMALTDAGVPDMPGDAGTMAMPMQDAGAAPSDAAAPVAGDPALGSVGLGSGGIGVSELEAATEFFTELVGMTVQSDVEREDRVERVLTFGDPTKPSVTLMHFADGRNTRDIPAKLVFYVDDPSAAVRRVSAGGYGVILSGALGVGQVEGFDGYVLEFLPDATGPMFVSIAFAVSDLTASLEFYSDALGLTDAGQYYAGTLQEEFVRDPDGGGALVLQHYLGAGQPNYKDNPVKTVFHVDDAAMTLARVVELGGSMVSAPSRLPALGNRMVGIAKDLDGYVIELVQSE